MVGENVKHKAFGVGKITDFDESYVSVEFPDSDEVMTFKYPDAFEKFLSFENVDLQNRVQSLLQEKNRVQQEEKALKAAEIAKMISRSSEGASEKRNTRKMPERKNLAFKLNFCDGGSDEQTVGYKGVCSDEMIKYNIEEAKRSWCCYEECQCRRYHDGLIAREELDEGYKNAFVCYESVMLNSWAAYAGMDLHDDGEKKARRMPNAQLGSLAVLTTRFPDSSEEDRAIIGVFIVNRSSEGDDDTEGVVACNSKYKMEIHPSEVDKLKFWNYYKNEGNPELIRWGTGLYRFLSDEDARRLLEDIVNVKENTSEHELALEILNRFDELHK